MKTFIEHLNEAIAIDAISKTKGKKECVVLQGRFQPPTAGILGSKLAKTQHKMVAAEIKSRGLK